MIAVFGLEPDATPRPEKETDPGRTDDKNGEAAATALPLPLVDLPEHAVGQEREQLDERDAGVALVEISPLRRIDRNPPDELIPEILIAALVENWDG